MRTPDALSEKVANRLGIRNQSVARKFQTCDRPLSRLFVAGAAGVRNEHRNISEVGAVTRCRLDSDLCRNADDDKGVDAAISQSEVEPCAFEGGHRQFVGGSPETREKEGVRGKIDWWVNAMEVHSFTANGPFVAHDRFVVQYDADVTDKESKQRRKLSKVGVYTVKNGKIVREEFLPRVD